MLFRSPYDLETVIVLEGSDHYEFINGEQPMRILARLSFSQLRLLISF